jgi:hypothetical protein
MIPTILLRFATVYIENLYPDIIKDKDPYETIETFLNRPNSGIQIVSKDGKQFLELYPHGELVSREITKKLVEETLYSFEIGRKDYERKYDEKSQTSTYSEGTHSYDVIEEISKSDLDRLGSYENKNADWAIQKIDKIGSMAFADVVGYQFIRFKNREMVDQINAHFK